MTSRVLRQALDYAGRGWPVFPCRPGRKTPATVHGHRDATTDPGQVRAWFGRDPGLNLAIATGAPGIDVLDVDRHGEAGDGFDWQAAAGVLQPLSERTSAQHTLAQRTQQERRPARGAQIGRLARWVAAQPEGNRNNGLFWAANRALETSPAADLSPLAAAARQAGLTEPEITATLDSARRTTQIHIHPEPNGRQAEGAS